MSNGNAMINWQRPNGAKKTSGPKLLLLTHRAIMVAQEQWGVRLSASVLVDIEKQLWKLRQSAVRDRQERDKTFQGKKHRWHQQMAASLGQLHSLLEKEELEAFGLWRKDVSERTRGVTGLLSFAMATRQWQAAFQKQVEVDKEPRKAGRRGSPSGQRARTKRLDEAIRHLWSACRDSRGNVAVGYRIVDHDDVDGGRSTAILPFVKGAHALLDCLPKYVLGSPSLQTVADHAARVIPRHRKMACG